jgi:hypothetical protein
VLFKLLAPQALKRPATPIQSRRSGEIGEFASKIAKFYATGGNARIFGHIQFPNSYLPANGPFSPCLYELHSPRFRA